MFNNRIKAKAKLYFDVDGESVTASEESLSDAAAKVKCIFRKQLFDPDKKIESSFNNGKIWNKRWLSYFTFLS